MSGGTVRILCLGRTRESYLLAAEAEYLKRLAPLVRVELQELKSRAQYDSWDTPRILRREAEQVLPLLDPRETVVILDEKGSLLDSPGFAGKLAGWRRRGRLTFVIGGPWGLAQEVKAAGFLLSLSPLTFTHQMIRVFLLEQIYRAFQIQKGGAYARK